jgi:hypothetical protein
VIFILVGIFLLILALLFNLAVAKTDTSKPLSKASEGGDMDVLWERGDITQSEVRLVSGKHVLIGLLMSWVLGSGLLYCDLCDSVRSWLENPGSSAPERFITSS